jgi:3-methylcrotonyl-CoA carboxylase alpha subunit
VLLEFRCDDEMRTVEVAHRGDEWQLVIDGREVALPVFRDLIGSWYVDTPQGRRRLWVAARGDQRLVWCDGKVHVLELPDAEVAEDDDLAGGGPGMFASMPGKVVKVLVETGAAVETGQAVLILESMKMETEITATMPGIVSAIHVQDGQLVGQGDALVEVTPHPESDPA